VRKKPHRRHFSANKAMISKFSFRIITRNLSVFRHSKSHISISSNNLREYMTNDNNTKESKEIVIQLWLKAEAEGDSSVEI
jgi:hypothetical protein